MSFDIELTIFLRNLRQGIYRRSLLDVSKVVFERDGVRNGQETLRKRDDQFSRGP